MEIGEAIKDSFFYLSAVGGLFLVAHKIWGAVSAVDKVRKEAEEREKKLSQEIEALRREALHAIEIEAIRAEKARLSIWDKLTVLENRIYELRK